MALPVLFPAFILLPVSLAHAQQANPFSGFFVTAFGQYTTGISTQRDNGFVYKPPVAAPATPAAPPVAVVPSGIDAGGIETSDGAAATVINGPAPSNGTNLVASGTEVTADGNYGLSGGFGGVGAGYNFGLGNNLLVGVVGDIGGGGASGSSASCGTPAHLCGTRIDAVSDVRGRLGYAVNNVLVFASGGVAVDHLKAYDTLFGSNGSAWRAGYVVGGGLEYKITPRLSLMAEYLHSEINSAHLFDIVPGTPERISVRSDSVRVSLNYSFTDSAPAPVIARY